LKDEGSFAKVKATLNGFEVVATASASGNAIAHDGTRDHLHVIAEQVLANIHVFAADAGSRIIQRLLVIVGPGDEPEPHTETTEPAQHINQLLELLIAKLEVFEVRVHHGMKRLSN